VLNLPNTSEVVAYLLSTGRVYVVHKKNVSKEIEPAAKTTGIAASTPILATVR